MWQESSNTEQPVQASMTDVVFRISCSRLIVDHAAALADAVCELAPQIDQSPRAGIHPIHVAGSQNGWERPEHETEFLLLSKRTRFRIRIDVETAASLISQLSGVTLDISGSPLHIIGGQTKALLPSSTLFSRYTFFDDLDADSDEHAFEERIIRQCHESDFSPTKILCGKAHTIKTRQGPQLTRSVMLADIPASQSQLLQDNGLGHGRTMGCGILIPHKDTGAVNDSVDAIH